MKQDATYKSNCFRNTPEIGRKHILTIREIVSDFELTGTENDKIIEFQSASKKEYFTQITSRSEDLQSEAMLISGFVIHRS